MVFSTDQMIHSLARSLASLRLEIDLKKVEGENGRLVAIALFPHFQEKFAEFVKLVHSQEEANSLFRRYLAELQEENAAKGERARVERRTHELESARVFAA